MDEETNPPQSAEALALAAVAVAAETEAPPTEIDLIEARTDSDIARIEAETEAAVRRTEAEAEAQTMIEMARQGSPELQARIAQCESRLTALETLAASTPTPQPAAVVVTSTPQTPQAPTPSEEAPLVETLNPESAAEADGLKESPATPPPPPAKRFQRL